VFVVVENTAAKDSQATRTVGLQTPVGQGNSAVERIARVEDIAAVVVAVEMAPVAAVGQVRLHHTGTETVLEALVLNHRVVLFAAAEALKADYTVIVGSALAETVVADSVAEPALEIGHTEAVADVLVDLKQVKSNQC
jgi:hypothetical protein